MENINRILLAADGSEHALKAATFAGDLARTVKANLDIIIVHSNELFNIQLVGLAGVPVGPAGSSVSIEELREQVEENATEEVFTPTLAAVGKLPTPPTCIQKWGYAGEVICETAESTNADIIVLGTRGRSTFSKLMMGSVSIQVLNHAHCPVTVVR